MNCSHCSLSLSLHTTLCSVFYSFVVEFYLFYFYLTQLFEQFSRKQKTNNIHKIKKMSSPSDCKYPSQHTFIINKTYSPLSYYLFLLTNFASLFSLCSHTYHALDVLTQNTFLFQKHRPTKQIFSIY